MEIIQFLCQHINTIISFFALIVAAIGVWYGKKGAKFGEKGYQTAEKIFKEGVQLDCDKVFAQLGLELTMNIIIPFIEFEKVADIYLYNKKGVILEQRVSTVYDMINCTFFKVSCPYWDMHKGDVWDAFEKLQEDKQKERKNGRQEDSNEVSDSFQKIRDFIEKSKEFEKGIGAVSNALENYMNGKTRKTCLGKIYNEKKNIMMADFFDIGSNKHLYDEGKSKIKDLNELMECIERNDSSVADVFFDHLNVKIKRA